MRFDIGRLAGVALVGLTLATVTACSHERPVATPWPAASTSPTVPASPTASTDPAASAAASGSTRPITSSVARNPKIAAACDAVLRARTAAAEALSPIWAVLIQSGLSHDDLAEATRDLNAVFTTLHTGVGPTVDLTSDAQLKTKLTAYQFAVEQAIVAIESSDSEQAKLKAVIEAPLLRSAEKAVVTACS